MMDGIQKQIQRGVLWEQAIGHLKAIDHTFYGEGDAFEEWVRFREKLEDERNDQGVGGF